MTKLDVNLSRKPDSDSQGMTETANLQSVNLDGSHENRNGLDANRATPIILVGEMDLVGQVGSNKGASAGHGKNAWENFNWLTLRRIAISQMVLSIIACVTVVITMLVGGMNSYKFSQFMMAIYLLITGQSGLRASAKSYKHLIFYTIMSSLQWMINMLVLGCLTFAVYEAPYYAYSMRHTIRAIEFEDYSTGVTILVTEIIGSAAMIGTIVTGLLGLTACCRGFGVMLANFEKFMQANQNVESA